MSVTDDVILSQVKVTYDAGGNLIQTISRERYHNAADSQTGALKNPSETPKARVTYTASYDDPLGRTIATANYGTNGGSELSRSATVPGRSDSVLVTSLEFDSAGNQSRTVDPSGLVTQFDYAQRGPV